MVLVLALDSVYPCCPRMSHRNPKTVVVSLSLLFPFLHKLLVHPFALPLFLYQKSTWSFHLPPQAFIHSLLLPRLCGSASKSPPTWCVAEAHLSFCFLGWKHLEGRDGTPGEASEPLHPSWSIWVTGNPRVQSGPITAHFRAKRPPPPHTLLPHPGTRDAERSGLPGLMGAFRAKLELPPPSPSLWPGRSGQQNQLPLPSRVLTAGSGRTRGPFRVQGRAGLTFRCMISPRRKPTGLPEGLIKPLMTQRG